ncbi:MAG TPA: four-carbon acid sugar kinase family protein [Steroidobacteraceae bacterium]|nr:four-carbon acid sugar kinase family protein [Steroidobacteraceae bacterium]
MDRRWLIIADDLTGAADSAIAFAKRRLSARVTWGEPRGDEPADTLALAFDADTRSLPATAAARRHANILQRLSAGRPHVFKKIDSTLRGHPAEEIGALLDVLRADDARLRAVFTPAFPAGGRTTRGGRVFVHGRPLEHTEFWGRSRPADHADVATLLESAGLQPRHVPLETVRGDAARLRATFDAAPGAICLCDAETERDLDAIAAAALDGTATFFAGSAGLAHSLAGHASRDAVQRVPATAHPASLRGALFLIGSQAGPSRVALESMNDLPGLRRVSVAADDVRGERGAAASSLAPPDLAALERDLAEGIDVVVDLLPDPARAPSAQVVDALARRLAPLAPSASALMATGGDTAAALLARCGVRGLRLVDELEPGASLGLTLGDLSVPIVTKSGGFGDAGTLRRIAERLRFIRRTGTLA